MNVTKLSFIALVLFGFTNVFAQADWYYENWSDSRIDLEIEKTLNTTRILYVAAHPDDENTRLISWMVNKVNADVAYLSLTNGSGGQNLIGEEIGDELGLIREQELYAARRIDGAQQYFTSAEDFGYSKSHEETFEKWGKQAVLEQVVRRIRTFKPHIIITRFSPVTEGLRGTHGHHTASAILAVEAFDAAADPNRFQHQLDELEVWKTEAIYWNTSYWSYGSQEKLDSVVEAGSDYFVKLNVDDMVFERGLTSSQIAAASRSMHKSQGFGTMTRFGQTMEYLQLLRGSANARERLHPFFTMLSSYAHADLEKAKISTRTDKADHILKGIAQGVKDEKLNEEQVKRLQYIYLKSRGLTCLVEVEDPVIKTGEQNLKISALHYDARAMQISELRIGGKTYAINHELKEGEMLEHNIKHPFDQAYITPEAILVFDGIELTVPVVYRSSDPVKAEIIQPAFVGEAIQMTLPNTEILVVNDQDAFMQVVLQANADVNEVILRTTQSKDMSIGPMKKGEIKELKVQVWNRGKALGDNALREFDEVRVVADGEVIEYSTSVIKYDHIPWIYHSKKARFKMRHVKAQLTARNVGYIMGAGDKVPEAIRALGATVDLLDYRKVPLDQLLNYDAVVFGIRALNVHEDIDSYMDKFYDYAEAGGTLIMQYNTAHRLKTQKIGGKEGHITLSRGRVTEEDAEVLLFELMNEHIERVFQFPNNISEADWDNWVQERGLYFPRDWDKSKLSAIIGMHDTGEETLPGSILVGKMGKGYYVYTGISFFRQLPAGVEGAYKVWANLLSL